MSIINDMEKSMKIRLYKTREISITLILAFVIALGFVDIYWNKWIGKNIVVNKETLQCKYDIFNDLLIILLSIGVLVGGILFLLLQKFINDEINKKFNNLEGKNYIELGLLAYHQGNIKKAIKMTERALDLENYLDEKDKIWIKNNLAYYNAALYKKHKETITVNKEKMLELAKIAHDEYSFLSKECNEPEWVETYVFVKAVFAENPAEKEICQQLIQKFLKRKDLEDIKENLIDDLKLVS